MAKDCVLLSGSWARGQQGPYSDIDLVLITENSSHFYTETIWDEDREIQIIILPKFLLHKMILEKSNESNSILISMLKSVVVLSDNEELYASKLGHFIDHHSFSANEHVLSSQMNILKNRCEDIKHCDDEFERSLLLSTIIVHISHLISKTYDIGIKHCIRALRGTTEGDELRKAISEYNTTGNYHAIISLSERTFNYYIQDLHTTGRALNNLKEDDIIVLFFPFQDIKKEGMFKVLRDITDFLKPYNVFSFHLGRLQFMNEGQYVVINSEKKPALSLLTIINKYREKTAQTLASQKIKMLYPYYTSFASGVFFGGKQQLLNLTPFFSSIWKEWIKYGDEGYSIACAILFVEKINNTYQRYTNDGMGIYNGLIDMLLPIVVDPLGVQNVEQTKILRKTSIKQFYDKYMISKNCFISDIKKILNNRISELVVMHNIADDVTHYLSGITEKDLNYPDISPYTHRIDAFYIEVCAQILSEFHLPLETLCTVTFNLFASQSTKFHEYYTKTQV